MVDHKVLIQSRSKREKKVHKIFGQRIKTNREVFVEGGGSVLGLGD